MLNEDYKDMLRGLCDENVKVILVDQIRDIIERFGLDFDSDLTTIIVAASIPS